MKANRYILGLQNCENALSLDCAGLSVIQWKHRVSGIVPQHFGQISHHWDFVRTKQTIRGTRFIRIRASSSKKNGNYYVRVKEVALLLWILSLCGSKLNLQISVRMWEDRAVLQRIAIMDIRCDSIGKGDVCGGLLVTKIHRAIRVYSHDAKRIDEDRNSQETCNQLSYIALSYYSVEQVPCSHHFHHISFSSMCVYRLKKYHSKKICMNTHKNKAHTRYASRDYARAE